MNNKYLKEWILALIEAGIGALILYFLFWPVLIDGHSMEETFYSGDIVITSKIAAYMNIFDRGDIILCNLKYKNREETAIKRLIGIPGDHIKIEENKMYINEILQNEDYISSDTNNSIDIYLEEDEYYVLGDNRKISMDSRTTGPLKSDDIIARVFIRCYPFKSIRIF